MAISSNLIPLIEKRVAELPVPAALELPNGQRIGASAPRLRLKFSQWPTLSALAAAQVGAVAEAYVEGQAEIQGSMRDLMAIAVAVLPSDLSANNMSWWARIAREAWSRGTHTLNKDAQQIQFHYDVSDAFYAMWLDPRRAYSCAYYRAPDMTLAQAQEAKLDHICRKLMLKRGERFLDIGSGWGALLLWAAEHYGVAATGITLSKNQHAYVSQLIEQRGLKERVRLLLCDYRELPPDQLFDKIASVGMLEHVGSANMLAYYRKIHALLVPGGMVLNHAITSGRLNDKELSGGMGAFIEKYIFPGGELLHVSHLLRETAAAGLEMVDTENLRPHYARTLWAWSDALEAQLDQALEVLTRTSGDAARAQRILRAYRLYLAGSAMSFERGWNALHQMLAIKPDGRMDSGVLRAAQSPYPFTRDYMYAGNKGD
ncbi:MAG: class I SAM-dependent methyltransferase [Burkholderiaceae bacterium]|jgi:cyclopropane-fatty-acyl-phospholipid synthase|nr:class I SAM-dependent methyltransferase [Burkholderiaceae bacterium]